MRLLVIRSAKKKNVVPRSDLGGPGAEVRRRCVELLLERVDLRLGGLRARDLGRPTSIHHWTGRKTQILSLILDVGAVDECARLVDLEKC